jgi:lysyl-tRNA synthetase class 2
MAAGFPKTFEIGRVYRNEGSSPDHTQEFTGLEFYWSFADFDEGVSMTEDMIKTVVKEVFGKTEFSTRGHSFNLEGTWPRMDYVETVEKMAGINILKATENEMMNKLEELKVKYDGKNRERLTDTLWKYCRKQIAGPAWLVNHPKLVSPLSKIHPDNPELTLRAQLILAGSEMTNGFSELNDPIDQKNRFHTQEELIKGGDSEAMMPDDEFVEMLEYGMPPTFGFAYGDRLFAFLADKPLRELQLFPLMRPKK